MKIKTNIKNLDNYKIYLEIEDAVIQFLQKKGYLKIELPVLSPALIPESYLEIFETRFNYLNTHRKLYLTPSPELFLKRLLTQGIGNCYYLGKAFRNSEPNSSWHSPEFIMLEFYKIGVDYLELAEEVLLLLRSISKALYKKNTIQYNHKKISFEKWEKKSVTQAFSQYSGISKKELFNKKLFIKKAKNKGYKVDGFTYEDLFSQICAAEIEPNLGKHGCPTLLYDYPKELASLAKLNKDRKTAQRCEFYIDGLEIGGFCTELDDFEEQQKRFSQEILKRKKNNLISHQVDKGFIEALKYGLPNCTGAGIGFERLVMIFANKTSIDQLKLTTIK